MVPTHKVQNILEDDIHLAIQVKMKEFVKLNENCWHAKENMNCIQLLQNTNKMIKAR
jgi:hypothetical protein